MSSTRTVRAALFAALAAAGSLSGCKGNVNDGGVSLTVTERVSVDSRGTGGNLDSSAPSISADGRYVAFTSLSDNLVSGATNGRSNVFLRDTWTGTTTLVSANPAGMPGNGDSSQPSLSADGRRVAFTSTASDLVSGDTNGFPDVFVKDFSTGMTFRVSVASGGAQSTMSSTLFGSAQPAISADGQYVAFTSDATDLVTAPVLALFNVYRHHIATVTTELVSTTPGGGPPNDISSNPSISGDGGLVAFSSLASDLVSNDTNGRQDIFVRNMASLGLTERASVSSTGQEGNADSMSPSISRDGKFVAFDSFANTLAPDVNGLSDVFVRDRAAGITTLVSKNSSGFQGTGGSFLPGLSADGRYVVFQSAAFNLVPDDNNGSIDIFWHDRVVGTTLRVSVRTYGAEANGSSGGLTLSAPSADGRFVAFESTAYNLVTDDTNGVRDVFLRGPVY